MGAGAGYTFYPLSFKILVLTSHFTIQDSGFIPHDSLEHILCTVYIMRVVVTM